MPVEVLKEELGKSRVVGVLVVKLSGEERSLVEERSRLMATVVLLSVLPRKTDQWLHSDVNVEVSRLLLIISLLLLH